MYCTRPSHPTRCTAKLATHCAGLSRPNNKHTRSTCLLTEWHSLVQEVASPLDNSLKQPDLLLAIPHPPHQTHIMKATHCFTATTTVTPHRRNMLALTMCHHLFLQLQHTHAAKMHQPNQQPLLLPPTYDASTAAATDAHSDCIVKLPRPVSHSKLSRPHSTLSEHAFMSKDANLSGPPQPGLLQHQPTTDQQISSAMAGYSHHRSHQGASSLTHRSM